MGAVDISQRQMGRRAFLGAAAAGTVGAAGALFSACAPSVRAVRQAARVKPAGSDIGAIEHVVLLMQENRSFDHYFGTYKEVRGYDDHGPGELGVFAQRWPRSQLAPKGYLLPFHLDTAKTEAECTFDLSHTWAAQHACWDHGAMDAFVTTHTAPDYEGPQNGVLTMGYYDRSDLPFYYALADAFTICDGYHCSVLGPTDPNRLFWLSATNDPDGKAGGPIVATSEADSDKWSLSWPTMPEALDDRGISWRVYNPPGDLYQPANSLSMLVSNNRLLYFSQYRKESSRLHKAAFGSTFPHDFARDVKIGTLPAVSWLVAPVLPKDMSEHPPAPPARGEYYTHQVLETLASNPEVWSKTVLFLSYDENDGFFDHVAPPTPPLGTRGEYLTVEPLPVEAGGITGPIGLGMRVPMLVVSPFSRGGHVFSAVTDHTSQLRFLEERFGVPVPNLSRWRRETTSDLTASLQMSTPVSGLGSLPATALDAEVVLRECTSSQQIELNSAAPPDLVPKVQVMPTQET
ncbi:MAG: alkaline phosphatase family protein [Acidimicrobiales bacterium]